MNAATKVYEQSPEKSVSSYDDIVADKQNETSRCAFEIQHNLLACNGQMW